MILNMFRASLCSSSGGQLYIYSIWYRPTLYAAIRCADQDLLIGAMYGSIQSVTIPDTVNIQIVLLKMRAAMLETW
jgi:hypothetical protein